MKNAAAIIAATLALVGCAESTVSQQRQDAQTVNRQQTQYAIAQPIPMYDYSLERDLLIQLYNVRNRTVTTHTVWRSDYGLIEGDCRSMGYGLPYDTSLTNPLVATGRQSYSLTSVGQPEPNGIFASTNTSATWVFCLSDAGRIEPVYIEAKVTTYPGPVMVDYQANRVLRQGEATVNLEPAQ